MAQEASESHGRRGSGSPAWPVMLPASPGFHPLDHSLGVPTKMNYVSNDTKLVETRRNAAGCDSELKGVTWEPTDVFVGNARLQDFKLHVNGFELCPNPISSLDIDFYNQQDVIEKYYPVCEALVEEGLLQSLGSDGRKGRLAVVKAFDHNVRCSKPAGKSMQQANKDGSAEVHYPAGIVHVDYSSVSAVRRLRDLSKAPTLNDVLHDYILSSSKETGHVSLLDPRLVEEAIGTGVKEEDDGGEEKKESKTRRRFAIVNMWRNISPQPLQTHPLAFVDAVALSKEDLRTFRIHYADRVGENYFVASGRDKSSTSDSMDEPLSHDAHKWWYYPRMLKDEALLLKQWDSAGAIATGSRCDATEGRPSTFAIHSAFLDPSTQVDAPGRESIEVRCVAIWEDDE